MATTLLGISGSLTKGGSTRTVVEHALRAATARYPEVTAAILDLREVTLSFCDGRPVHEYTDDTPPVVALMGKVAGLIATGATDHHYLSIDQELRPVLIWFNMHLVPGSVYVRSNQLQGTEIIDEQVREHLRQLGEAVSALHQRLQGSPLGPPPLSL